VIYTTKTVRSLSKNKDTSSLALKQLLQMLDLIVWVGPLPAQRDNMEESHEK